MNAEELRNRIQVRWKGYGTYEVTIEYRNKYYRCTSHNSLAYDRINVDGTECYGDRQEVGTYTYKSALQSFYDECKRKNDLY